MGIQRAFCSSIYWCFRLPYQLYCLQISSNEMLSSSPPPLDSSIIKWGISVFVFHATFSLTQTSLYLLPKSLFLWGYCPLDTKSWHLWILEERKSKMVLRSILKIIYCYFRVCFALPNVFWQSVFLQHCLAVKGVKESSLGCCARQEL